MLKKIQIVAGLFLPVVFISSAFAGSNPTPSYYEDRTNSRVYSLEERVQELLREQQRLQEELKQEREVREVRERHHHHEEWLKRFEEERRAVAAEWQAMEEEKKRRMQLQDRVQVAETGDGDLSPETVENLLKVCDNGDSVLGRTLPDSDVILCDDVIDMLFSTGWSKDRINAFIHEIFGS